MVRGGRSGHHPERPGDRIMTNPRDARRARRLASRRCDLRRGDGPCANSYTKTADVVPRPCAGGEVDRRYDGLANLAAASAHFASNAAIAVGRFFPVALRGDNGRLQAISRTGFGGPPARL